MASTIRVGDLEVCHVLEGRAEAPVLMLAHSLLSSHAMWDAVAGALAPRWRVLRYDIRGHGGTTATPAPYTMQGMAQDAIGLLDALGLERVHFVGTSLGGMIGQQVGARFGARLRSLTLANTTAVQGMPAAWDERIASVRAGGIAPLVEPTLQRWFRPEFSAAQAGVVEVMRQVARSTPAEGYIGCASAVRALAQADLLPSIHVPTLVIAGEHDGATPPAEAQRLQQGIAGARLVTLPAGHQAAVECPAAFVSAWEAFAGAL